MTAAETARERPETTGPAAGAVHFPGFESLRAIAAVMVVVHHAAALAGPGRTGHLNALASVMDSGVAVFFVISGFLIYRPFAVAHLVRRPAPRVTGFWWRRVLRIVPAYWLALTFFWVLGNYRFGTDWWRYYLFLQIYSVRTVLGGIVQAWSLCTEMTFYLVIPGIAWLLGRAASRRATPAARAKIELAGIGGIWVLGFVSRAAMDRWAPSHRNIGFMWLPTNLDLFATGMALAALSVWAAEDPRVRVHLAALARHAEIWWAAAAVLFAWYAYAIGPAPFTTGYAGFFWQRRQFVLALFSALLLVPAVFGDQERGVIRRVWSWAPIAWVGSVSYGVYLWHFDWMKRAVGMPGWPGWLNHPAGDAPFVPVLLVGLVLGSLFAAVSWSVVEEPLQGAKNLVSIRGRGRGVSGPDPSTR